MFASPLSLPSSYWIYQIAYALVVVETLKCYVCRICPETRFSRYIGQLSAVAVNLALPISTRSPNLPTEIVDAERELLLVKSLSI
jgi:hypothetical protein